MPTTGNASKPDGLGNLTTSPMPILWISLNEAVRGQRPFRRQNHFQNRPEQFGEKQRQRRGQQQPRHIHQNATYVEDRFRRRRDETAERTQEARERHPPAPAILTGREDLV